MLTWLLWIGRLAAACLACYLIAGACVAVFFVTVINPNATDAEFLAALILTWPMFVVMALVFWFAAGV